MTPLTAPRVVAYASHDIPRLEELPAAVRGFWTDRELLRDSGLTSVPLLKKVCGTRWLIPDHGPLPTGGHRRVWVFNDVVRAAITAEVAERASMSAIAVSKLLAAATGAWTNEAISFAERTVGLVNGSAHSTGAHPSRLVIVDAREAWAESRRNQFDLLASDMTLPGQDPAVSPPSVAVLAKPLSALAERGAVLQIVDLGRLDLSVFGRAQEQIILWKALGRSR